MSYGQYSTGLSAGKRWTKAAQIASVYGRAPDGAEARKVGHNRTEVTHQHGRRDYILHRTIVASLDGDILTLNDGGWPTMTTRRAMGQAMKRWGIVGSVSGSSPKATHTLFLYVNGERMDLPFHRQIRVNVETGETVPGETY